jgi:predicted transcriptional regulator
MTDHSFSYAESSSTDSVFPIFEQAVAPVKPAPVSKAVVNAVYSHIQAVRTLGRDGINTREIASALSLPVSEVDRAVKMLDDKGVKITSK